MIMKPTNSLPRGHPNRRKIRLKVAFWATVSHRKYFFRGLGWIFYQEIDWKKPRPNQNSLQNTLLYLQLRNHPTIVCLTENLSNHCIINRETVQPLCLQLRNHPTIVSPTEKIPKHNRSCLAFYTVVRYMPTSPEFVHRLKRAITGLRKLAIVRGIKNNQAVFNTHTLACGNLKRFHTSDR